MKISDLIRELTRLKSEHGDLPVILVDADTSWLFPLKEEHLSVEEDRLEIEVSYIDEILDD